MNRTIKLITVFLVVLFLCPAVALATSPVAALVSMTGLIVVASLLSGICKLLLLDRLGEPSRPIGRPVFTVAALEFVVTILLFAYAASWTGIPVWAPFLLALAAEYVLGVPINWLVLTRAAKPKLGFWVAGILGLTLPVSLTGLYFAGLDALIYEALGG